jgi:hypothetical protein
MKIQLNNIIIISPKINILVINNFWYNYYEFLEFLKYIYLHLHFEIEKKENFLNPNPTRPTRGPTPTVAVPPSLSMARGPHLSGPRGPFSLPQSRRREGIAPVALPAWPSTTPRPTANPAARAHSPPCVKEL